MSRFAWLTPDTANSTTVCRVLVIPEDILTQVSGALLELTYAYNWEEFGVPVDDALALVDVMWQSWQAQRGICVIGTILPFAISTLPDYVLPCDGGTYQRTDYPDLYSALDPVYIIDADQFSTPDLRGRTVIGSGQGTGLTNRVTGDSGGSEAHQLITSELPSHSHTIHSHDLGAYSEDLVGVPIPTSNPNIIPTTGGSTGGDQPHNNIQPFHALTYGIVAK